MTEQEQRQACDALGEWFKSQDIKPKDACEIMAKLTVVACCSMGEENEDFSELAERVEYASKLPLRVLANMIEGD